MFAKLLPLCITSTRRPVNIAFDVETPVRDAARAVAALAGYSVDTGDLFTFARSDDVVLSVGDLDRKVGSVFTHAEHLSLVITGVRV
jgi:hypothetical protein